MYLTVLKIIILIMILLIASYTDIRTKCIPNKLIIYGSLIGAILTLVSRNIGIMLDSFLGFLICGGILLGISLLSRGGLGMGDVKLMACEGIYIGLGNGIYTIFASIVTSGIISLILLAVGKADKKTAICFAPFLLVGTIFTLMI